MNEISIVCEPLAAYLGRGFEPHECSVIQDALAILKRRLTQNLTLDIVTSPSELKDYLRLKLAPLSVEAFGTVWLDSQHRVLVIEEMFRGTLTQTSVYPREIVRRALSLNAASVVLYHNHPSGSLQPSRADEHLTQTIKQALALVDVRVLDHMIIGSASALSMAEQGFM